MNTYAKYLKDDPDFLHQHDLIYHLLGYPHTKAPLQSHSLLNHLYLQGFRRYNYYRPDSGVGGFINKEESPVFQSMFINTAYPVDPLITLFHEGDHLRTLRSGVDRYKVFGKKRADDFVKKVHEVSPYLLEKYPELNTVGYIKSTAKLSPETAFDEIMATLLALEMKRNLDLTEDPVLKNKIFDPITTELYRSMTGWRSTRWDAKDPPPNTPRINYLKELF